MDYPQLTPDPEVFARVWARVVPEGQSAPIEVRPPAPAPPGGGGLSGLWAEMEGLLPGGRAILHRDGRAYPMWKNLRRSARQLRAARFLLTGEKTPPAPPAGEMTGDFSQLVRGQYLRETDFAAACRDAAGANPAPEMRELLEEQAEASRKRQRMLRDLLAGE